MSRVSRVVSSPGARQVIPAAVSASASAGTRASAAIRPVEPSLRSNSSQAATTSDVPPASRISKKPGFSRTEATGVRPGAMCGSRREA